MKQSKLALELSHVVLLGAKDSALTKIAPGCCSSFALQCNHSLNTQIAINSFDRCQML